MSGLVAAPLLRDDYPEALRNAKTYREIFGDRFYIEVMRHGMKEQDAINEGLVRVARELELPIVATNDSHYLERKDASAHDVLLCIGTGKTVADTNRMKFYSDEFYVKSPDEMYELWSDLPEACENTVRIAERVDIRIPEKVFHLPQFPVPQQADVPERSDAEYLREICERGLIERYGDERVASDGALRARLEYELEVITKMGFSSYFLIVWDFVKYARDHGIPVGPGRGSAVGSLVAYCLRITDLDPLRFQLLFERFLNPERISMPDIDTDFCVERRDEVIAYVTAKYGKDRVAQIVTFGTMAARAAIRDAGRALGVPLPDVDRIAKLFPSGPGGYPIDRAIEQIAELKTMYATQPADTQAARHGEADRGAGPQREHARRGRRDLGGAADRVHAARALRRRRHQHAVRHGLDRAHRPAEDGFSGAAQPHGDGQGRGRDPAHRRRRLRSFGDHVRGRADLSTCSPAARRWESFSSSPRA